MTTITSLLCPDDLTWFKAMRANVPEIPERRGVDHQTGRCSLSAVTVTIGGGLVTVLGRPRLGDDPEKLKYDKYLDPYARACGSNRVWGHPPPARSAGAESAPIICPTSHLARGVINLYSSGTRR